MNLKGSEGNMGEVVGVVGGCGNEYGGILFLRQSLILYPV